MIRKHVEIITEGRDVPNKMLSDSIIKWSKNNNSNTRDPDGSLFFYGKLD